MPMDFDDSERTSLFAEARKVAWLSVDLVEARVNRRQGRQRRQRRLHRRRRRREAAVGMAVVGWAT